MAVSGWLRVFIISPFPVWCCFFTPSRTSGTGAVTGNFKKTSAVPKRCVFYVFCGMVVFSWPVCSYGSWAIFRCGGCHYASSGNPCRFADLCQCGMCGGTVPRRRWIFASLARWWRLPAAFDTVIAAKPIDSKLWRAFKPLLAALCSPQQLSREPFYSQLRPE